MTNKPNNNKSQYERLSEFNNSMVNFNIPFIQMGEWMDVHRSYGYPLGIEEANLKQTAGDQDKSDLQ
ncbi:hypothetical protein HUR95_09375 [Caldalkalibacillus thermarum TA2.A1]|uniref:Uncharacterized protein n=1 Tax=Caldalkalibacillus thermarum (strain TA2.A1) TaxID=986075 RepID=A0A8X8I7X4_CALTT|nr:hypothetical protein [Caldalkalibacillus thermarum]QZT32609.1 hypothetical protein HUR95_09375 [Caldalkalibacillus thermarum TA2.A1]